MLNYFVADNGTYLKTGIIPPCKWFSRLGMEDDKCIEEQTKTIVDEQIDFLITDRDISLIPGSPKNYSLVFSMKEEYNWEYADRTYYLYQRID